MTLKVIEAFKRNDFAELEGSLELLRHNSNFINTEEIQTELINMNILQVLIAIIGDPLKNINFMIENSLNILIKIFSVDSDNIQPLLSQTPILGTLLDLFIASANKSLLINNEEIVKLSLLGLGYLSEIDSIHTKQRLSESEFIKTLISLCFSKIAIYDKLFSVHISYLFYNMRDYIGASYQDEVIEKHL